MKTRNIIKTPIVFKEQQHVVKIGDTWHAFFSYVRSETRKFKWQRTFANEAEASAYLAAL